MARKKNKSLVTKARSVIANYNPKSPVAEQFRTVRTNLQFASIDKELETMLVTSPGPSEGKSIVAANIAVVFAQQGKKVLLVDADLRKPTVHYTFRVDNNLGLSNYLVNKNSFEELIGTSEVDNLDILPSGPIPPNPSELLGSKMMKRFVEKAKESYDMVIFDTPPVLAVTDSQVLSQYVEGSLLVVRSKQTENESAVKAKENLEQSKANILGVVLNDRDLKASNYYYYYGNG